MILGRRYWKEGDNKRQEIIHSMASLHVSNYNISSENKSWTHIFATPANQPISNLQPVFKIGIGHLSPIRPPVDSLLVKPLVAEKKIAQRIRPSVLNAAGCRDRLITDGYIHAYSSYQLSLPERLILFAKLSTLFLTSQTRNDDETSKQHILAGLLASCNGHRLPKSGHSS